MTMTMNKTQEAIYELDVKIQDTVNKSNKEVAQEYLDTIVECLKNTHYLNDLEIQEMFDKSFHFAEQLSNQESA